jgi:transglutaminase-like putative cysteine protease
MQFLTQFSMRPAVAATWLLVGVAQVGCDPQSPSTKVAGRSPIKSPVVPQVVEEPPAQPENVPPPAIAVPAGVKPWITTQQLPWEAWYLQYLDGKRIGYSHVQVDKSTLENETRLIRIRRSDIIEVVSNGTATLFNREMESKEYVDGRLISLHDVSRSLENVAVTEGILVKDLFNATTTIGQEVTTNSVAWEAGAWGVMGLQAMLMQHPPQPGELLEGKVFVPQLYKIAQVELLAGQPDVTTLPGGKTESLIPVDIVLRTEDTGMRSRNWINARGEVLKTISRSGPNLSTFWTTAEVAEPVRDEYALQELLHRRVPIRGATAVAAGATRVTYNLTRNTEAMGVEVYSLLAKSKQQVVTSQNALNAEATVHQSTLPEASSATGTPAVEPPGEEYLATSAFVAANHPRVKQFAQELLEGSSAATEASLPLGPVELALRLTQGVHKSLQRTPLDRQVVHPLQTLRVGSGDCVDQALLLVSLLRSQQIPARLAGGLAIDADQREQMQFDMWTEAWLVDRWVALDPATGQVAAPDRLKILDSSCAGPNPYKAILPVFGELQGLEVKLVSHE